MSKEWVVLRNPETDQRVRLPLGPSWPAFFFTYAWLLWKHLWFECLCLSVVNSFLLWLSPPLMGLALLMVWIYVGANANEYLIRHYYRKGFSEVTKG